MSIDLNTGYPAEVLINSMKMRYVASDKLCNITKTGKHFDEYDRLLQKIKEG